MKKLNCIILVIIFICVVPNSFLFQTNRLFVEAQANCTSNNITISFNATYTRKIYQFNCYVLISVSLNQLINPSIPLLFQANTQVDYTELDLSPNRYTTIPVTSLCNFKSISALDLSSNLLTNLNGFFDLRCLNQLESIDLSNNFIMSPFTSSLFDDTFASRLRSINFTNNRIQTIQSSAFIAANGKSRFPLLSYIGLANNLIVNFDILWPLSLPSSNLLVDLKFNPIERLVNEFNLTFKNGLFDYPMINKRYVDVTTNKLQYLDDTNLLQYGIVTQSDFFTFMNKISNYDFRQANLVRTFICYCPPKGLLTVFWYKSFANAIIDRTAPIYNLFCSNFDNYIFDFPCTLASPINETLIVFPTRPPTQQTISVSTSIGITRTATVFSNTTTVFSNKTTNSSSVQINDIAQNLLADQTKSDQTSANQNTNSQANNNLYFLLLLLLIPLVLILVLLFICCIGRWCQIRTDYLCDLVVCPCMRPDDEKSAKEKNYDATICYSEYDENWLDEHFLPQLSQFENNFKIHKLSLYHRSTDKISRDNERILRSSKRIILIFSKKFLEEEWSNKSFRNVLRDICQNDPLCVIICVNVGEFRQKKLDFLLLDIETSLYDHLSNGNQKSLSSKIKSQIKYNCGLNNLERLHVSDIDFWRKFNFIMPRIGYDNTKPAIITDSSREKKIVKLPKLASANLHFSHQNNHRSNSTEKKAKSSTESETSLRRERIHNKEKDAHLSYASNYKNSKSLRHIIVPIPDFMRTQLGYGNTKSVGIGDESISSRTTNSSLNNNVATGTVTPEKIYLDQRSPLSKRFNHNNLLITNQTTNELEFGEDRYNFRTNQFNRNKISIINSHLDFLPDQTNTLVKNYLPSEREVIKMSVNARNGQNGNILSRSETPEIILDMFRPKSVAAKKMRINVEEDSM